MLGLSSRIERGVRKSMGTQATCQRFYRVPGHEGSSGEIKVRVVNSNL